jgi:hypothetical protein
MDKKDILFTIIFVLIALFIILFPWPLEAGRIRIATEPYPAPEPYPGPVWTTNPTPWVVVPTATTSPPGVPGVYPTRAPTPTKTACKSKC